MSTTLLQHGHSSTDPLDDERAQKVAAARKKLKTFRQSRSTSTKSSNSTSSSRSLHSTSSSSPALQPTPLPLTINNGDNIQTPPRSPIRAKGKEKEVIEPETPNRLRKQRSKGSMGGHRRQQSSVSGGINAGPARMSGMSAFEMPVNFAFPGSSSASLVPPPPSDIVTTPATPATVSEIPENGHERNKEDVKARMSTFSFGAKASSVRARSPNPSNSQPLLPSQALASHDAKLDLSPNGSPKRLGPHNQSTPSRPPSLFLVGPTPVSLGTPSAPGPSRPTLAPGSTSTTPSSPSTPARSRKHSHTRSNSISLPNLKLTSRPISLGIPTSPSFPSSPCPPASGNTSDTLPHINGTRLKFEPSGRGAEAEREKEEYRRKALEKLTGGVRTPPMVEPTGAEISLPDLDDEDEDTESVASSARPFSGAFGAGFTFGRPNSLGVPSPIPPSTSPSPMIGDTISSSPVFWSSPATFDDTLGTDRWSGFSIPNVSPTDEGVNFGAKLVLPVKIEVPIGLGLPTGMNKRPSLTRNLSVLAEVDEPEEGESVDFSPPNVVPTSAVTHSPESETHEDEDAKRKIFVPIVQPIPSRLRELHLLSAAASSVPSTSYRPDTFIFPRQAPASPPKAYGAIGRGRPRPLSGIPNSIFSPPTTGSSSSTPITGIVATPRSGPARRTKATSKGSSISYKKDGEDASGAESVSSRWSSEYSVGSRGLFSPPPSMSPPLGGGGVLTSPRSPGGKGSGSVRPCPRPKSLVGLGLIDGRGSNRVLGEVDEEEEYETLGRRVTDDEERGYGWGVGGVEREVELERDALTEDLLVWRERCRVLEEKLEGEKRESGLLRERLRKLGDRLSSFSLARVSGSTPPSERDVTSQIFALSTSLETERREKELALARIAELEETLRRGSYQSSTPINTPYSYSSPQALRQVPSPIITPATPLPHYSPIHAPSPPLQAEDQNHDRMKAWGFPRQASNSSITSRSKARESFFGLSSFMKRDAPQVEQDQWAAGLEVEDGLDLPPLPSLLSGTYHTGKSFGQDMDEEGLSNESNVESGMTAENNDLVVDTARSVSSGTTSAMSYLATYLPTSITTPSPEKRKMDLPRQSLPLSGVKEVGMTSGTRGVLLDFRRGCSCCLGDVFEF